MRSNGGLHIPKITCKAMDHHHRSMWTPVWPFFLPHAHHHPLLPIIWYSFSQFFCLVWAVESSFQHCPVNYTIYYTRSEAIICAMQPEHVNRTFAEFRIVEQCMMNKKDKIKTQLQYSRPTDLIWSLPWPNFWILKLKTAPQVWASYRMTPWTRLHLYWSISIDFLIHAITLLP